MNNLRFYYLFVCYAKLFGILKRINAAWNVDVMQMQQTAVSEWLFVIIRVRDEHETEQHVTTTKKIREVGTVVERLSIERGIAWRGIEKRER